MWTKLKNVEVKIEKLSNILSGFSLVGFVKTLFKLGLKSKIGFKFKSFVSPANIQNKPFPNFTLRKF